ncbi:MAG: hypothetical protein AAF957_28400, partial [Planctomycetota bacterium]
RAPDPPRPRAPEAAPPPQPQSPPPQQQPAQQPPPPQQPPAPAQRRESRAPRPTARVQTNSTADRWQGFLRSLEATSPAVAELIGRKGALVRDSDGVAPLKLRDLSEDERAMIADRRNARSIQAAFAEATGGTIRLKLEVHDPARRGDADPFTNEIAELFGGRIEE